MASAATRTLSDRYTVENGIVYLSGLQALVRLPLDLRRHDIAAGRDTAALISGYEGSPLAGYDLELARQQPLLDAHGVVFRPGLNEELAANAVQGSQLAGAQPSARHDGVIGIWYGKAPGLDRASDALRHGNLGGAHPRGGALVLVGDDSTAKSSTVPSSSELAMAELGLPVLSPADPQDILDLGIHGIAMSRFSGLWVGMKVGTNLADGSATTEVAADRVRPKIPDNKVDGLPYVHAVSARFLQPTLTELERSMARQRLVLASRYAVANGLNRTYGAQEGARVGIITSGASYLEVRQALVSLGLKEEELQERGVRLMRLGLVFPLDPDEIIAFAEGLDEIIVIEEKRSFAEGAVKEILYGRPDAPAVSGKTTLNRMPLLRGDADLDAEQIATALKRRLPEHIAMPLLPELKNAARPTTIPLPLLARTPYFCSGCPHNRSTRTPDGSLVGAGIGCSGMVAMMPSERVGDVIGLTQMGGEGGPWIGMSPFVDAPHLLQNMGDGTFHHSGSLAIRAAVASGANITYKILYNSAVAMTGGQDAVGAMTVPELVRELLAEGVARIVVTTEEPRRYRRVRLPREVTVRHRDALVSTQMELAAVPGVTVLIHDQECATELRRKRKRKLVPEPTERAFINQRICEGCGDCGDKSNCLSVQPVSTEYGRKTQIHQASCNKDYSCLDGDCPSFLTVTPAPPGQRGKTQRPTVEDLDADRLPGPSTVVPTDEFGLRITGIGGTGVVTVSQVIATAAARAGRFVRTLDQTGLAQKGGAVVSDVKISTRPLPRANKLGRGEADLYLGCDVLVAATDSYLRVASADRTVGVVSTAEVPTGAMITDTTVAFPEAAQTAGRIAQTTRPDFTRFLDARELTQQLFDDDQSANVFLVGVAYQLGALPIDAEHLEEALTINGVAVQRNLQAFRRGRQLVADPDSLHADIAALTVGADGAAAGPSERAVTIAGRVAARPDGELADLIVRRVQDLIDYQDAPYAEKYADLVERARAAEARTVPDSETFALATAQHLHKLMAYKDEYEVARLSLDPALQAALLAEFGPGYRASYRLHPPVLRALGVKKKLTLGPWFQVVFRVLFAMRGLRGTPLDPFGWAGVRRTERALSAEYQALVVEIADRLAPDNHGLAVQMASLPDMIRGYEHVKEANVTAYRERLAELRTAYGRPPARVGA